MKKFKFTIQGNDYEVDIKRFESGQAKIEVNGTPYEVEIHKNKTPNKTPVLIRKSLTNPEDAHQIKKNPQSYSLRAPLPGNILHIQVKPGDEVNKGDKLLIYEAMKMENVLLAERPGLIKEIKVKEGDSVLQDDVLIVFES